MSGNGAVPGGMSDEELVAAIGRRDERAVAALYDRYGGLAYSLAYRILEDRGAAEDVVQDAFVSAWRRAVSFQPGRGSVRTWLLSIVHHRAIDRLRGTPGRARREGPLDVHLPDYSGHEVCRALKQDARTKHIPVMILTGEARTLFTE